MLHRLVKLLRMVEQPCEKVEVDLGSAFEKGEYKTWNLPPLIQEVILSAQLALLKEDGQDNTYAIRNLEKFGFKVEGRAIVTSKGLIYYGRALN